MAMSNAMNDHMPKLFIVNTIMGIGVICMTIARFMHIIIIQSCGVVTQITNTPLNLFPITIPTLRNARIEDCGGRLVGRHKKKP